MDLSNLNELEKKIYYKLLEYSKNNPAFRINEAAKVCNCSISKISKFVKKLGFQNYKQYLFFLYGEEIPNKDQSDELTRIKKFIDDFDTSMVDEFLELINSYKKIVVFGYGPSGITAEYFEYKFRILSDKIVAYLSDETSILSIVDERTLLIIFTVTGSFRSFENLYNEAKKRGCDVAIVAEEYNTSLFDQCDRIFWLSKYKQPDNLLPHEKSRTIFFIFIEEVIRRILENKLNKKGKDNDSNKDD
jgi:DNA-binding MurR/RpiR family transcriptional regulator